MSKQPESTILVSQPTPNLSKLPQLLHKLWDLDQGNIEAIPYVELHVTSPLLPPPLEDVNRYPYFPGPPPGLILHWDLSHSKPTSTTIYNDSTLTSLASTIHTMQHSYVYWFQLLPPSSVNVLGTSLDLLGTPPRVTSHNSNYY
ncbi:hypothetical protein EV359DRAFT_68487 [Lentinula novae-zelandiae]|nr:hypothetical protein EV359DRAFT_68487 [Lentinula novae-zelandiae]